MTQIKILLTSIAISIIGLNISQSQCLTDEINAEFARTFPNEVVDINNIESDYPNTRRATKYIIPVVFHVLHTNGPENISKEQILEQMRILNEDFSLTNANKENIRAPFKGLAADGQIEFRLAKIDPDGNCTDGIHRVYTPAHIDAREEIKDTVKSWNYLSYLNVWTVSSIRPQNGAVGTTLGYAYLPFSTSAKRDGIVMRADAVGDYIGTARFEGSTLTHEAGHYFGLQHTFQGECDDDDLQYAENTLGLCNDDTPPVATSTTNGSCNVNSNSCKNDFPDNLDMWENYMDYSDGHCQSMFTSCQVKYMQYLIESNSLPRKGLYTQSNLIKTGVLLPETVSGKPVANFNASATTICVGEEVQFYDESCKQKVESRKWTLNGSSTSSTNTANPIVTYASAGTYEVTLDVSNSSGSDSKTISKYINVRPNVAQISYIEEPVEDDNYLNEGWSTPEVNGIKWKKTDVTAYTGNSCFVIPIKSNSTVGSKHHLDLPAIDLRVYKGINPKISFMVGYRRSSTTEFETMRILISTDCGQSFQQRKQIVGAGLSTSGALSSNFIPSAQNEWRRINYNLSDFENDSNVIIRLEVESAATNSVYVDDINVSQFYTGINQIDGDIRFLSVYPNPNNGKMSIELEGKRTEQTEINLIDLTGKKVSTLYVGETHKGLNTFEVENKENISSGIYYLQITVGGISKYEKISILK